MAKCALCNKGVKFGIKVSHSHRRANRTWKPNVKSIRMDINGTSRKVPVCTSCLKTLNKENA